MGFAPFVRNRFLAKAIGNWIRMNYRTLTLCHEDGERLPMLVDQRGLPIIEANVFALTQRGLAWRSIKKKLRSVGLVHEWANENIIDLAERIASGRLFSETEINGSLISFLKRSHQQRKVQKLIVAAKTFNVLVMHAREYLIWRINTHLVRIPATDHRFHAIETKRLVISQWLAEAKISTSTASNEVNKGLSADQLILLLELTDPKFPGNPWTSEDIRERNRLIVLLLIAFGLRPAELQTVRVEDLQFGAISAVEVIRRPHDPNDPRPNSPEVKRSGRVLPIMEFQFAKQIDNYIMEWRPKLEDRNPKGSNYLVLSKKGDPISYSSIAKIFQRLREVDGRFPKNFSAKTLRHVFSGAMERKMRESGIEDARRGEILAFLRGDTSEESHKDYIREEIKEQAKIASLGHQAAIFQSVGALMDVPC